MKRKRRRKGRKMEQERRRKSRRWRMRRRRRRRRRKWRRRRRRRRDMIDQYLPEEEEEVDMVKRSEVRTRDCLMTMMRSCTVVFTDCATGQREHIGTNVRVSEILMEDGRQMREQKGERDDKKIRRQISTYPGALG